MIMATSSPTINKLLDLDLLFNADECAKNECMRKDVTVDQLQRMYDQGYIY